MKNSLLQLTNQNGTLVVLIMFPWSRTLATVAKGKGKLPASPASAAADDLHRMPTPVPVMMPAKRPVIEAPQLTSSNAVGSLAKINPALIEAFKRLELPKFPAQSFATLGAPLALVRSSLPEVLEKDAVLLEGGNGVGKSMILLQLASLWLDAGKTFLYFPRVFKACQGYYAYEPGEQGFEQPDLAMAILKHHFGGKVEVSKDQATATLESLLFEQRVPLILDEVNSLFKATAYHNAHGEKLPVEQMRVLNLLKKRVLEGDQVYAAVCRQDPRTRNALPPGKLPIMTVPALTLAECTALLDLYHRLGMMGVTPDAQINGVMHLVSGGNGVDLLRAIRYDTLYLRNPEFK